jgi:hypothetical protein
VVDKISLMINNNTTYIAGIDPVDTKDNSSSCTVFEIKYPPRFSDEEIEALREQLKSFLPHEDAEKVRAKIKQLAEQKYVAQYPAFSHMQFLNRHESSFTVNHAQSVNHPYYWTMFSVISQHVQGDTIEECIDQALFFESNGGRSHVIWMSSEERQKLDELSKQIEISEQYMMWGKDVKAIW